MTIRWPLVCLTLTLSLAVPLSFAQNPNADSELNLGIAAYENGKNNEAINHLERAVTLRPNSVTGHFYLAESYDSSTATEECDWSCDEKEQRRLRAIQEYKRVLELEPTNTEAMKALGWRYYRRAERDDADRFYRKALEVDPNDFEALYTLAVIQWQRSYGTRAEKRAELKLGPNKRLINLSSCSELRSANLEQIEEGMSLLARANGIGESYDVRVYLSLLYRERADIQCGDQSAYDQDVNSAIEWSRRACDARQKPDRVAISCMSLRCPPPAPPPAERGQAGDCQ